MGSNILNEAERLYGLGFGVHWIKPKSKVPVGVNWDPYSRPTLDELRSTYKRSYGIGVRLGTPSTFGDGTVLANLDVDIKSDNPAHKKAALECLHKHFPDLFLGAPEIRTGYGLRLLVRLESACASYDIETSDELVKVHMPTSPANKRQELYVTEGHLTAGELADGYRMRPAWQLSLLAAGKQAVLPPSIHPDTGSPYVWSSPVECVDDIPLVDLPAGRATEQAAPDKYEVRGFVVTDVPDSDPRWRPDMRDLIDCVGVTDRSVAALSLALKMLRVGFTDDEIISTLTDRDTAIGETAYEHAAHNNKAKAARISRQRAGVWAERFVLQKAKEYSDPKRAFAESPLGAPIKDEPVEGEHLIEAGDGVDWTSKLRRKGKYGDGAPDKDSIKYNTWLALSNAADAPIFKYDEFSQREKYTDVPAPWRGWSPDRDIEDADIVAMMFWLSKNFRFEPSKNVLGEAVCEVSRLNTCNPVKDEFDRLPPWDGIKRIDTWLATRFGAVNPPEYTAQVFRKWLIASITRTYAPGYKFDWLPIFEGKQGLGKTTMAMLLFGGIYQSEVSGKIYNKDTKLSLVGLRVCEFGELHTFKNNSLQMLKSFISIQSDKLRPPFGHRDKKYHRTVVFYGTTNCDKYLVDPTGNRRFCPVAVTKKLDFELLLAEREQLWAEALYYYNMGYEQTLELEGEAAKYADKIRAEKTVETDVDVIMPLIADWRAAQGGAADKKPFPLSSLFGAFGPLGVLQIRYNTSTAIAAAEAIKKLGAVKIKKSNGNYWQWPEDDDWGY